MTNLDGLWVLFAALLLLIACFAVTLIQLALLGVTSWRDGEGSGLARRLRPWSGTLGIVLAVLSWLFVLVFTTPAGLLERLGRPNPVLIVMLIGFTVPAIIGGYLLWAGSARHAKR